MVIRFQRINTVERLILFIFAMPFAFFFLIDVLGLPSLIKYSLDAVWVLLLLLLCGRRAISADSSTTTLLKIVGAFFACTIVGFLLNYQSAVYYLWGLRNNLRFFVFFFACILFLRESLAERCIRFMDTLFYLNIPVMLYQYFVMGKSWDYLGGIFGVEVGCNGYVNIFFAIVITRTILAYMNKTEKPRSCFFKCGAALVLSALAELKVFFIEFILIIMLASLLTRFSMRKMWIFIGAIVGIAVSLRIITNLFPQYANWFSFDEIWKSISSDAGYTSQNDMNRMTAITISSERFLPTVLDKLFGLGLGNCDYASFDFLITPFYRAHNKLHYTWFSSAFTVLETGFVGLTLYVSFFIAVCLQVNKKLKNGTGDLLSGQMALIMSLLCLVLIVYNSSLRIESAYMVYFVLALPFIRKSGTVRESVPKEC